MVLDLFSKITHVTYQNGENLIDKYKGYDFLARVRVFEFHFLRAWNTFLWS